MKKTAVSFAILMIALLPLSARAQQSADQTTKDLIRRLRSARIIELNFVWDRNSPLLGLNPPFSLALHTSHAQTKGFIPGGIAFAADMMFFSGQHGAPTVDALGHISNNMKLYGGGDAAASEGAAGLTALGIEAYPKDRFINRAVLLDVAQYKKMDALPPGYEITAEDLEATARAKGVEIQAGDSVLIGQATENSSMPTRQNTWDRVPVRAKERRAGSPLKRYSLPATTSYHLK
jgi:hypothetical protein